VIERILTINRAIRGEAFAGTPAHAPDTVINILDGIKDNLALQEEAADSPAAAIHGVINRANTGGQIVNRTNSSTVLQAIMRSAIGEATRGSRAGVDNDTTPKNPH
jgi:hypothetical protein